MNRNKIIINRLLENKSIEYQKKYFILSTLCNSSAYKNKKILEETVALCEVLNETNGEYPTQDYLFEFHNKVLLYSGLNTKLTNKKQKNLKEYIDLNYSESSESSLINEELNKVKLDIDNKLNKKLLETLYYSIRNRKNLILSKDQNKIFCESNEYTIGNIVDLTNMFSDVSPPSSEELAQISSEEFEDEDLEADQAPSSASKIDATVNKIIDIFGPITGGRDPAKVSKKDLATMLGFKGNGKYTPGQKDPVLSAWDMLEISIIQQANPYGRSRGMSTVAQRKWWIIESIKLCLMLEKQANYYLGLSDQEKSRIALTSDEKAKVGEVVSGMRSYGKTLSNSEIDGITQQVQDILIKGEYNLEDNRIKESELMNLLHRAASSRKRSMSDLKSSLDIMYPLHDTRPDFERVPQMSSEEREELDTQNVEFDARKDAEDKEIYGDEIDPETGEKLYADEEEIARVKASQKVIEKEQAIKRVIDTPNINMTVIEYGEFMKQLSKDLSRLKELDEKSRDRVNPDIFSPIETDAQGNIIPDIDTIPDMLPAEELSDSEIQEVEEILARLNVRKNITIIGLDQRGEIYDELCDKAVSVDEFIAYRQSFGLDSHDKPMNWEDIARASYGKFRDSAGARQFGVKTWLKGLFYSMSPESKSNIYSYLAERWYERLKVLDLIDDKSFVAVPDPKNPGQDKAVSADAIKKLKAAGKYSRSQKLEDISEMLEMISKYTSPKYIKRYFDTEREDSLDTAVNEKIESLMRYADSEEEYDQLLRRLVQEDEDTASYALIHSMFNGNSGFRIFATGILKEYYNDIIWPNVESSLALAVKEYFQTNYRGSNIGASLQPGQKSDDVRPEEGKELFNKIIYLVMQRTGISSSGSLVPNVGDSRASQVAYFKGQADPRGDFAKAVANFNAKPYSNKLYGRTGSTYNPLNRALFNQDDVDMLLRDMFDTKNGIIGKVSASFSKLTSATEGEIITWIGDYPEAKLDQAILLGMSLGDFYRRSDADPSILEVIEKIGKDTKKALDDYKKKYKGLLLGKDFAEYLDYEYGLEPYDPKSKGSSNPGGKNFQ